jgi:N-acetyl-gamma-glutamyl-phosphate reductase
MRIAVVGASGYAGSELLRLLASHPDAEVVLATGESSAGTSVARHVPALAALYPETVFAPTASVLEADAEVVFLALPHGQSQSLVPRLLERGSSVVDLGADFRLREPDAYERWYGEAHRAPHLLDAAVYGLVERHRDELAGARLIAVPGCYPTASSLVLGPLVDRGLLEPSGVIVNALSGVSGAGRATSERLQFSRLAANAEAYGLLTHRHTPEIEQELGAQVLFTPHLVPVSRGMLVTAYGRATSAGATTEHALAALREAYAGEPFVVVSDEPPALKDAVGSNLCLASARIDPRTGWVVAMSSIDNLIKGAAGQAIQAWNVARGVDETAGLSRAGLTP